MLQAVSHAFWSEALWLPPNTTWEDVAPAPDKEVAYTDYRHLSLTIPMALVLVALRFVLHKYVYAPVGKSLGIKHETNRKTLPNPKLEAAYKENPASEQVYALAKQLDMSEREVQRWWRRRRSQDKPSILVKFCESAWRASFLLYNFICGWLVLWDKEWLWEVDHCYIGYPHHGITNDVWWFYMVALAFYWSQTLSLCWDVRRKDFWQQVTHHAATVTMMCLSWMCNLHRIGSLVMLSHDGSETLLEALKATRYAGYHKASDYMFAVFAGLWIATRLGIYSYYIVGSATFRAAVYMPMYPMMHVLISLLWVLLALNVFWTWLILQVAYKAIRHGQVEDIRSSSSEVSDSSLSSSGMPKRGANRYGTLITPRQTVFEKRGCKGIQPLQYTTEIATKDELITRIREAFVIMREEMQLKITTTEMRKRGRSCIRNRGLHFEHVI